MARKDEAYIYLKNKIVSNEMHPGEPVSELTISQDLNMSRSPIREALRQLESEGMVESFPGRGCFVSRLSISDVQEIYELRTLLESWCLERGFDRIPSSTIQELRMLFAKARVDSDGLLQHQADREFHERIVRASGSRRILGFLNQINDQIERLRRISSSVSKNSEQSYQEHMAILDAIEAGDKEEALQLLNRHLQSSAAMTEECFKYLSDY